MYDQPRLLPAGDSALVVEFGNEIAPEVNARIRSFTQILEEQALAGIVELVPTYRSVLSTMIPCRSIRELEEKIKELTGSLADIELAAPEVTMVPVCYGEIWADLDHVCQHTGLSAESHQLHTGTNYLIYMLGFTQASPTWGHGRKAGHPRLKTPGPTSPPVPWALPANKRASTPSTAPAAGSSSGAHPEIVRSYREPPVLLKAGNYVALSQ